MAFVRIMIHIVWGTKNRAPIITKNLKPKLLSHIKENAKKKEIFIDSINGVSDHVHCLISLNADMSISKAVQLIKGESAFWINKEKETGTKFEWGDEYFAISVSESLIKTVRDYIENQEEHHQKMTFSKEYELFMKKYGFDAHG
jgi:putative transposase